MTEACAHGYECWIRWSDVDAYGHVNNVNYFEYFQEARIRAMRDAVPGEPLGFVVARIVVDYKRPLFFRPEPYLIETRATRIGRSSFDLAATILDPGDARTDGSATDPRAGLAVARTTVVAFDGEAQRSRPLTDPEADAVRSLLAPTDEC